MYVTTVSTTGVNILKVSQLKSNNMKTSYVLA